MAMTHRERVVAALSHREPDLVPIDFGGKRDTSIVIAGYERLKEHFGVQAPNVLTSRMMQVVDVDEQIMGALDTDTRGVYPAGPPDETIGDGRYRDEWGVERVRPRKSLYYDQLEFPLSGSITPDDIARYDWPDPDDPVRTTGLKERVKQVREQTDCAIVLNLPSAFVHTSQYLRGFEDWFMDFVRDPKLLAYLFDAVLDIDLAICRRLLEEVGSEVDVLMASDDLGLQGGPMISPDVYRELLKPRHAKYFGLMHELSPAKVLFHSCGSVADLIGDFVDTGVDVLNPVQVSATGMEPARLKKEWGGKLAFWGAIDTQHVLPHGTVAEVEAEVERCIEALGEGGGYVVSAVHNLQPDVPTDNVLAMYRHARAYRPSFSR